jgi:hypothetical protein
MQEKLGILKDLFEYLMSNKMYWLIPIVIVLLVIMVAIILGQVTGLGPLIYPFI